MTVDTLDYLGPQIPLHHGAKQVYSAIGQVIAPGATFNTGNIAVNKPGYLIRLNTQMSAAGSATPFLECDLTWSVTPNNAQVTSEEIWYVNCGGASAVNTRGKGPTKGNQVSIAMTNGDAVNSVTVAVQVWETTQHITRDDWRNPGGVASATATQIGGDGLANILGMASFSVNAGVNALRNMPLYAGPASIWINQNAAAGSVVSVVPVGDFNVTVFNPLVQLDWTAQPFQLKNFYLPRCPCQVQALNQGAGAVTFSVCIVALENTS